MAYKARQRSPIPESHEIMKPEPYRKVVQEPYKAKSCFFYKDGDTKFKAIKMCIHPRRYHRFEALVSELSTKVKLPFGVRSIFTPRGRDMITSLDKLENGESYVCSPKRHQARGVDPSKVIPPPRWYYDKPPSGSRELKSLLQEYEFEDRARFVGRRYKSRDQKMADAYNRSQPKKITVLKNGDPQKHHVVLINRKTAQMFEQILSDLSGMFGMAVRKLFTMEGKQITNLTSMINGPDVLVAAGKERFKTMVGFVYEPTGRESRMRSRMDGPSRLEMSRLDHSHDRVASRLRKRRDRMTKTRGRWKVWCTTSELGSAGTTAQVTITVYGHKGNSGPIPLGFTDKTNFQPGQVDEFDLNLGNNLGEIYKVRIAHDNTGISPAWFCDEVRMQDEDTDEILVFPCRRWLSREEDDYEICRELPALRKGEPHLPVITYEVTIVTGDLWNGGTQANVYLTIYGDRGDSGVRQMYVKDKDRSFNKGQTNHFTVEAVSLGHLKRVIVGHDGTIPGEGWFLEKLSIQEPEAKPHEVYHFYCGRWLDEGEDDGKIVRELKVQDEYMEDILEKRNWEFEKWKFESKNQVKFLSMMTGKALRVKPDGTVDGLGEDTDPGSTFIVSSKKPMIRIFTSLLNGSFHLAIDHGRITGQGRGGPQCEFRIHVQSDRTVMLEGAKAPLQFVTLQENGKLGDSRSTFDKDPAKRFHVYAKGTLRHRGIIMLRTSNTQAINVDHDKAVFATGRCNRAAHFRVHKVEEGIRMFESMIYPGFYLRLKDGKFDCNGVINGDDDEEKGSRNEDSHFLIERHKDKGYFTLQLNRQRGMYIGFTPCGGVRPTLDSGTNNIHVFPEVIEFGTPKQQLANDKLTPISERTGYNETPDSRRKAKMDIEEGDYRVLISSAASLDQGQVALVVYGDKGSSGQIVLSGPTQNGPLFKAGSIDEFKINLAKVGKIFKARLELAPRSQSKESSWKVQKLVLIDMNTQEKLNFDFNRWLSREREDQDLARELPVIREGNEEENLPVVTYFVTVYTGKDPDSETDAQVYINLFGDFGDCGKRQLRMSNRTHPFQRGQSDTFELEAVHLGNLNKVVIGHDETRPGQGWFLDKVVIREGKTANMEFIFPCGRWLDSSMEDRKLERILMVQEPAPSKIMAEASKMKKEPKEHIQLWITTHSESGAMQNAVELYVYGKDGCAGPIMVGSGRDGLFKPGATDEVQLSLDKNVGALYKVRIGLTEEQPGYEWHLEKLKLKEQNSGQEFDFDVGRWMSRKKEDCDVWRELPVARFEEPPLPVIIYSVEVHTSDISGADTEAPVYINLIGQRGDSGKRRLYVTQTDGKIFSQGKIDKFVLEAVSLGAIKSVVIGHPEKKPGDGWHLSYVAVKEYDTNDEQVETYFPCDKWFDAGHEDGKTERELYPGQRPKAKLKSDGEFRMWVSTAEDSQPSNGGKAVLVVYGDKGHSEDIELYAPSSTAKLFEPENSDEFEVSTGDIGDIYKIRITREDKPDWKAWHLDEIKMEDKTTGEVYVFSFDRWLSRDMDDGDLSRELPVVTAGRDLLTVKSYQVQVATGDHWAAETDANVWITMFGSNGDTGKRLIHRTKSGKRKFQRGGDDVFTLEAVDLKNLETVLVSHDGKGPGAGWFLEHISVTEVGGATHDRFIFPCGRWLDEGEDDGKTERMLRFMDLPKISESHPLPSECGGQWKVKVRTSDLPGADTRAQVYLTVQGTRDMSHPVPLGDGSLSTELFNLGKESMFDVAIGDIGELTKIRLEHDNRNRDPAWHVDWVQMKHLETGFDCLFTFDRWLDENKDDGQVFRECALESPGWMPPPVLHYIILIQTGRKPNSGAHGGVCSINLIGSQGDTGQQLLTRPLSTAADCMKDGILDVYMLEAVCVGEVRNIRLGFEGKGRAKQWFVESVKVMESLFALSENVFRANCTLDDENNTAVVLPLCETGAAATLPNGVSKDLLGHSIPASQGSLDICFWTGKQDSAGARDPISLVLYGTTGPSPPIYLNKEGEFHAGSVVHNKIESGSIGDLFKIRLAFAERIGNASWFLERIKLKNKDSKQEFNFEFNNWIHCTADNQDGMVELPAVRPDIAPLSETSYKVTVSTGDIPCAETSSEVTLMLIGQWGDSGQRYLTKPRNNKDPFKRGQTDEFELKLLNLGKISKILIGHSEHGRGQGWFCQQVAVTSTGEKGENIEAVFACNRWFDTGVDDRKTLREFSALGTVSSKNMISQTARTASNGIWTCRVKMAAIEKLDVSHISHGASHQVSLVVYGSKGVTGPLELGEGKGGEFMPGQVDSFKGLTLGDIGELTKLRVSSGIEGDKDGTWIIEEIWLEDEMTREKISFDFSKYVGEVGGDVRKEMPVIRPGMRVPALIKYLVKVETEDAQGAGTTARVYATLYGSKGDSGRRLLHTQEGITPFGQGEKKEFEIEAVDLGELEKIVVTKGPGDPWMLNQIIVKAGQFGPLENIFIWSNWVGTSEKRDQEVEITLPVISGRPSTVAVPTNKFPDFPVTRGQWNVETQTGPDGTRGDASDVILVFCGNKGESSPLNLTAKRDKPFQPGMTDNMELSLAEDVGELIKIRLGFEDNSQHKSWHLKKIHFEDSDTRDTFWFSPNSHIAVNDVSDGWKEFPVIWPGVFILPVIRYTITVETGDVPDASTSVQILVKLDGQMGSTGYRVLKDTRNSEPHFQQGKTDQFVIEAVSLMTLDSVTIGHINQTPGAGWFLSRVTVRPDNEEDDYVFVCNRWFDAGQDDGETLRTLLLNDDSSTIVTQPSARPPAAPTPFTDEEVIQATSVVPLGQDQMPATPSPEPDKGYVYEVTTVTGRGTGHGVHASVVLVLYGEKGQTEPLGLAKDEQKIHLKEGETQQFKISADEDVGALYKIRVGFNSGGDDVEWYNDLYSCPSWFAHSITLREARTGKEYIFESRQWVRMEDDHDFWREFPVKTSDPSQMLPVRDYFVDVYTGQRNGAGTKANVYVQLCGERGDSGWRHLHGSRTNANKFETGSHDLFRIEAVDLGKVSKVNVKHDGFGHGSGWYLDKVKVKESEESNQVFLFECDRWLDEGEDDRKIERELPLTAVQTEEEEPESARAVIEETAAATAEEEKYKAGDWRIFTVTSDEAGSGTDAYVTLTVFGDKGDSGPLPLGSKRQGFFEDGQTDQFDIWLEPDDIGQIKKVRLQHDNSGVRSQWRVNQLVMENLLSGEKYTFDINRLLSYNDQDGDVVFEGAVNHPDKPALKACKYMVKTVTEAEEDAGTNANVYINIIGSEGDTGKRFLMTNIDESPKFAMGKTNYFIVEAVDLGNLEKIVIGHDGMEAESSWKLQCVMIRKADSQIKETSVFPWGKWLTETDGSEVTIPASEELQVDEDETLQHGVVENDEMPDLHLALPETARTDNQGTYRTDEGYQESEVFDGTYRTDESLAMNNLADIQSDTDAAQTARMYTATDSSVDPSYRPPTDDEANNDEEDQVPEDDNPDTGDDIGNQGNGTEKEDSNLKNDEAADRGSEMVDETGEEDDKGESASARPAEDVNEEENNSEANNEDQKDEAIENEENPDEAMNAAENEENPERDVNNMENEENSEKDEDASNAEGDENPEPNEDVDATENDENPEKDENKNDEHSGENNENPEKDKNKNDENPGENNNA